MVLSVRANENAAIIRRHRKAGKIIKQKSGFACHNPQGHSILASGKSIGFKRSESSIGLRPNGIKGQMQTPPGYFVRV
jgi:hypothetical protein